MRAGNELPKNVNTKDENMQNEWMVSAAFYEMQYIKNTW